MVTNSAEYDNVGIDSCKIGGVDGAGAASGVEDGVDSGFFCHIGVIKIMLNPANIVLPLALNSSIKELPLDTLIFCPARLGLLMVDVDVSDGFEGLGKRKVDKR